MIEWQVGINCCCLQIIAGYDFTESRSVLKVLIQTFSKFILCVIM